MKSIIQNKKECWKDIKNYEGKYQISNLGNIRSLKFINNRIEKAKIRLLKPQVRNGYFVIHLSKHGKRKCYQVHRLVAQEFIENPNNYTIVNHKDYNPKNNKVDNLEWCTQKQNVNWSRCNMIGKNHISKNKKMYGIFFRNRRNGYYEVTIKKKYYGNFKTLNEAIKKRDDILNELNIAI